ncbi:MAG: hypothetical protein CYPHOPRED_003677 [Cyphobasidiales sp. Tagirdzhanova-0007]|nr:MAG: hypothetical protein CYPHOPRED_003677 [Cyphobasidiales sp. Tagirdzhanova-0007]
MSSGIKAVNFASYQGTSDAWGLSSAVIVPSKAKTIALSGMVGYDMDNDVLLASVDEQIGEAFKNATRALLAAIPEYQSQEEAWKIVYDMVTYHTSPIADATTSVQKYMKKYFGSHRPCWTAVGVKELVMPGLHFEMSIKAAAPDRS